MLLSDVIFPKCLSPLTGRSCANATVFLKVGQFLCAWHIINGLNIDFCNRTNPNKNEHKKFIFVGGFLLFFYEFIFYLKVLFLIKF